MENLETKQLGPNDLTEEQEKGLKRMLIDFMVTAFNHIDWKETAKDFADHHKPQEYCAERDDAVELFDLVLNSFTDCDEGDNAMEFLNSDEFYAPLLQRVMDESFEHERELEGKTEQLN